jgi:hypothetical protein
MSDISSGNGKNLLKFNGPFRLFSTDTEDNELIFGEYDSLNTQVLGHTTYGNYTKSVGDTSVIQTQKG